MAEEDKLTIKISKKKEVVNKPKRVKLVLSKEEVNSKEEANSNVETNSNVEKKTKKVKTKKEDTKEDTKEDIIGPLSTVVSLREHCKKLGIKGISKKNKTELLEIIKNHN